MKLAWVAATADPNVASFRYRCAVPAWSLRELGHDSTVFVNEMPDADGFDALIAVKNAGERLEMAARQFRLQGKPVFVDLCDNVFVPGYAQRRGPDLTGDGLRGLSRHSTDIVTTGPALERIALAHLGRKVGSWIVPDAALTPDAHQAICAWLPQAVPGGRRRTFERLLAAADSAQQQGAGRDKHDQDQFRADTDWQVDHLPEDTARVIWFGRHGTIHADSGMDLLKPVIAELERLHRDRPIELVVISNNRVRFDSLTHDVRVFTRYEEWSSERVFFELSRADLFVMPSGVDAFSLCKSANRAVLALANGVPVVASYLEALEPLRDVLVIDDWRAGIEGYLLYPRLAEAHLALARPILAAEYSVEAIGRKWDAALGAAAALSRRAGDAALAQPA
jgi:glycosyltransferase involved in cell wall biosynthesis